MSAPAEDSDLKGGHAPAVKAGGMRVARVQKNSTGDTKDKAEMTKEELELYGTSPPKVDKQVLVSGIMAKEDRAYPPEAIKQFHEHPLPSKEHRPIQQRHNIHQPW
jgi:hypothetical protein